MTLIIKYFGMTAEASGKDEEVISKNYLTLFQLKKELLNSYPVLKDIDFKIAVNQTIVSHDFDLLGNEEIAFLPPFSGG
jgi:molybdopterin synthase sulfur carrier subunit